ncbi:MAG: hypothetical protein MZU97_27225 [Bacillus subtilis]|nr:hypothetical protein [Bacillus subtilis]
MRARQHRLHLGGLLTHLSHRLLGASSGGRKPTLAALSCILEEYHSAGSELAIPSSRDGSPTPRHWKVSRPPSAPFRPSPAA